MKNYILNSKIRLIEGKVHSLIIEKNIIKGVMLSSGEQIKGDAVIITTGTFLRSEIIKGKTIKAEGPDGKETTSKISEQLESLGIELIRLKTGTPPRIKKNSIDFSKLSEEPGSKDPIYFSEDINIKKKYQNIPA